MDGIGTLYLIDRLLKRFSAAIDQESPIITTDWSGEWKKLSPSLQTALDLPTVPSDSVKQLFHDITLHNDRLTRDVDVLTLPFNQDVLFPSKHQRVEATLSPQQTKVILLACKALGVSITHVYHAATAITLNHMQKPGSVARSARYINYALVNLRPQCKKPYSTSEHAASVYHSVSPHNLAVDMDIPAAEGANGKEHSIVQQQIEFTRVLKAMKSFYLNMRDDQDLTRLSPLIWTKATPACTWDTATPPPIPPPNQTPSVSISSMGNLDGIIQHQYGRLETYNPWVTGEELGTGLGLFLGTFRGQLSLSAAFNLAWHDVSEISRFLQQCHEVVTVGLGV